VAGTLGLVQHRLWTRDEYHRLAEAGVFRPDERVELLDGEIYTVSPHGPAHASTVHIVAELLGRAFKPDCHARAQVPIVAEADERSEPEPDVAIVRGTLRDYLDEHPSHPLLVVEVAYSSLAHDREVKGPIYARARIADYWIVNLVDAVLEVYRDPAPEPHSKTGWAYRSKQTLAKSDRVRPLAAPSTELAVSDLLP
jgi:Uma2 family endonuclease